MKFSKEILTLILIVPFLTELLTYNIPATLFFKPVVFLALIIIYGFSVLIIREISVRWGLGLFGMLLLGIAYGIYNEGIVAKTILMTTTVPLAESYGHYKLSFGINFAFALAILTWHSFHSVLFPILILNYVYPKSKDRKWIKNYQLYLISIIVIGVGVLSFFTNGEKAPSIFLLIFYGTILLLIIASRLFRGKLEIGNKKISPNPVFLGMLFMTINFIGLHALGSSGLPVYILYIYFVIAICSFYKILKEKGWLTIKSLFLFGLGSYLLHTLFLIIKGLKEGQLDMLITGTVLSTILAISILYVNKSK